MDSWIYITKLVDIRIPGRGMPQTSLDERLEPMSFLESSATEM